MARRFTLLGLLAILLAGGLAAPALALAGYRFFTGDGFSAVLGVVVALVIFFIIVVLGIAAFRPRR